LFLGCLLLFLAPRVNAAIDKRVVNGSLTEKQAAYYKRFLRPVALIGGLCCLASAIMGILRK